MRSSYRIRAAAATTLFLPLPGNFRWTQPKISVVMITVAKGMTVPNVMKKRKAAVPPSKTNV